MSRSTEKVALSLIRELKKERERQPDLLKCRRVGEVGEKVCRSQEEFDRVVMFCVKRGLLDSVQRGDGMASLPNESADAWIEERTEKWTFERRFIVYGLVVTVVLAAIVLLWQLVPPSEVQNQIRK